MKKELFCLRLRVPTEEYCNSINYSAGPIKIVLNTYDMLIELHATPQCCYLLPMLLDNAIDTWDVKDLSSILVTEQVIKIPYDLDMLNNYLKYVIVYRPKRTSQ